MKFAKQVISNDKIVRSKTVQDIKDFHSQSFATQAKEGERLFPMILLLKKTFDLKDDDIVELSTENESLKDKLGSHNEKRLEESEAKLLKQIGDEKKASLIMSRMEKQMKK